MIVSNKVSKNLSKKGYKIKSIKKVKSGVYYLETNKDWLVLKTNIKRHHWLFEFLFRARDISFKNECIMYKNFNSIETQNFDVPELIATDYNSFLVVKYIYGKEGYHNTKIDSKKMAKALVEFQKSKIPIKPNKKIKIFQKLLIKNYLWILKFIKYKELVIIPKIIILKLKLKLWNINSPKNNKNIISNNDVGNIIKKDDGSIVFYDLETLTVEREITFKDIARLSVLYKNNDTIIDSSIIIEYLRELKRKDIIFDYQKKMRKRLLNQFISTYLSLKRKKRNIKGARKTLNEIILNDKAWKEWYENEIERHI